MKTFTVAGNYGTLTARQDTGEIVRYDTTDSDYSPTENYCDIICLDVQEFLTFMRRDNVAGDWDILYFGFWTADGAYDPAIYRDAELEHGK